MTGDIVLKIGFIILVAAVICVFAGTVIVASKKLNILFDGTKWVLAGVVALVLGACICIGGENIRQNECKEKIIECVENNYSVYVNGIEVHIENIDLNKVENVIFNDNDKKIIITK